MFESSEEKSRKVCGCENEFMTAKSGNVKGLE